MKRFLLILPLVLAIAASGFCQEPEFEFYPSGFGASAKITQEPLAPDNTPIQLDLPKSLHMKNVGGSDGAGLCVFTSMEHAARWQNIELLFGFQTWCRQRPGGGYPEKVDRYMDAISREKNAEKPRYIQIISRDLNLLRQAFRSGRMVSITYCYSPAGRYGGSRIAHMVTLAHLDDRWACVIDNNFPGTYEWMSPDELLRVAACGQGNYWAVVFLDPGPPPPPTN